VSRRVFISTYDTGSSIKSTEGTWNIPSVSARRKSTEWSFKMEIGGNERCGVKLFPSDVIMRSNF